MTKVRTQNLRDFTVQIRHPQTGAIVGTGFVVTMDGRIVTCAHVVRDASVERQAMLGVAVDVYFPQRSVTEKLQRATMIAHFAEHDDDVVLLQLQSQMSPIAPEQIAILGTADQSRGNAFESYGYRRLEAYLAGWARGQILGDVEPPEDRRVQLDPIQLRSGEINGGMSGAPVLDVAEGRNLVVGIVSETWFPDVSLKDRDTAWAVDGRILSFSPFDLPIQDVAVPLREAPQPKIDIEKARAAVAEDLNLDLGRAPALISEWVGREELLETIDGDWCDQQRLVTGLVGFGGEGKTSLARRWVQRLLKHPNLPKPDGIFWWNFYDNRSVDEFFTAALRYLGGGRIDPSRIPAAHTQAQVVGAMLGAGRYLFVLDGFEVMQHERGDDYALIKSADLAEFLTYFAAGGHDSFCLLTSRAPILDLINYITYTQRSIDRLNPIDGRNLLCKIGVQGTDAQLDQVVTTWEGHALTLSLLASYLVERYNGDIAYVSDVPHPAVGEGRYAGVQRVLRRYDEYLTETERLFLRIFSAFRLPVQQSAFKQVFRDRSELQGLNQPLADISPAELKAIIQQLLKYRILRFNLRTRFYTLHPLVRGHYLEQLEDYSVTQQRSLYRSIKNYYLDLSGNISTNPKLNDLNPLLEAIYYLCKIGAYDNAWDIYWKRINQQKRFVLIASLCAYETALSTLQDFFPDRDTSRDPCVTSSQAKFLILEASGICWASLGYLDRARLFYERAKGVTLSERSWEKTSLICQRLAELHAFLGSLKTSAENAQEAYTYALRGKSNWEQMQSLVHQAIVVYLQGDLDKAEALFSRAETRQQMMQKNSRHLFSWRGIWYADFLRHQGKLSLAETVTIENLQLCEQKGWLNLVGRNYKILGDLALQQGDSFQAAEYYDQALDRARRMARRDTLISILSARGRWAARSHQSSAQADLQEALEYALTSGYRLYEADIRVGLAWLYLEQGHRSAAQREAERAKQMSESMGYHWGKVDAEEVLERLAPMPV